RSSDCICYPSNNVMTVPMVGSVAMGHTPRMNTPLARLGTAAVGLVLAALSATFAAGCAGAAADAAVASDTIVASPAAASSKETFAPLSDDAQRARIALFQQRNGAVWGYDVAGEPVVQPFTGAIRGIQRKDPVGPAATVTEADARDRAIAFVRKNADLLGV